MTMPNRNKFFMLIIYLGLSMLSAAFADEQEDYKILRGIIQNEFQKQVPSEQGTDLSGVLRRFKASDRKTAILLGACLDQGAEADESLFRVLQAKEVPASLFVDQAWLEKNSEKIKKILSAGKIQLENHGLFCRPLSVAGQGVKNHPGTAGTDEVFEEIEKNSRKIESFSGRLPRFFKAGYDFYDDVALKIVTVLGYVAVQGDLKLRAGDVVSDASLKAFTEQVQPGSMIVIPANRPGTADVWLPKLLGYLAQRGYQVVALDDVIDTEADLN